MYLLLEALSLGVATKKDVVASLIDACIELHEDPLFAQWLDHIDRTLKGQQKRRRNPPPSCIYSNPIAVRNKCYS